jgi:hypothetical protein
LRKKLAECGTTRLRWTSERLRSRGTVRHPAVV